MANTYEQNMPSQSRNNICITAHQNLAEQKESSELADSRKDAGLNDLETSDSYEQWGEIVECPQTDCSELEPDHLREFLNAKKDNVTSTLELLNAGQMIECSVPQDPITEHTMQLNKFGKEVDDMIKRILVVIEKAKAGKLLGSSKFLKPIDFPPFPKDFPLTRKLKDKIAELYSESPSITPHAMLVAVSEHETSAKLENCRQAQEQLLLTKDSHKKLLVRSIAFFLHYAGYESVDSEALDVFVSTVNTFFENVLYMLRKNADSRIFSDDQKSLQHALEKTLREIGFGGTKGLFTFYQEHVIDKHQDALEKCVKLHKTFYSNQQLLKKLLCKDISEKEQLQAQVLPEDNSSKLKLVKNKQSNKTLDSPVPSKNNRKETEDEALLSRKKKQKSQ